MRNKLIVGSVFAAIALFASLAVSHAQFGNGVPAAQDTYPPAGNPDGEIEQIIRTLYTRLNTEKASENPKSSVVARHAELRNAVTKYLATERINRAIVDLELIVDEMPNSDERKHIGDTAL